MIPEVEVGAHFPSIGIEQHQRVADHAVGSLAGMELGVHKAPVGPPPRRDGSAQKALVHEGPVEREGDALLDRDLVLPVLPPEGALKLKAIAGVQQLVHIRITPNEQRLAGSPEADGRAPCAPSDDPVVPLQFVRAAPQAVHPFHVVVVEVVQPFGWHGVVTAAIGEEAPIGVLDAHNVPCPGNVEFSHHGQPVVDPGEARSACWRLDLAPGKGGTQRFVRWRRSRRPAVPESREHQQYHAGHDDAIPCNFLDLLAEHFH